MVADWELLKRLTSSNFARYVAAVPVVGWLLVYQNSFSELLSKTLQIDFDSRLSWELLIFYLGLILIGATASLFRIFGPTEVLDHEGLHQYITDTEEILTPSEFEKICLEVTGQPPLVAKEPEIATGQTLSGTRDQWLRLNSSEIRDVLTAGYRRKNDAKRELRILLSVSFGLGATLTLIPTFVTIFWVIQQFFGETYIASYKAVDCTMVVWAF